MSIVLQFINIIESNIIDKNYQLSNYKDDIITYHWLQKNIILDILIKENICAIKNNDNVSWYSLDDEDIETKSSRILLTLNRFILKSKG